MRSVACAFLAAVVVGGEGSRAVCPPYVGEEEVNSCGGGCRAIEVGVPAFCSMFTPDDLAGNCGRDEFNACSVISIRQRDMQEASCGHCYKVTATYPNTAPIERFLKVIEMGDGLVGLRFGLPEAFFNQLCPVRCKELVCAVYAADCLEGVEELPCPQSITSVDLTYERIICPEDRPVPGAATSKLFLAITPLLALTYYSNFFSF